MSPTRTQRPIVSLNQLRSLALLGGVMVVVPFSIPARPRQSVRKRTRPRRTPNSARRSAE